MLKTLWLSRNSQNRLEHKENHTEYRKMTRKPRSHVWILIYQAWAIQNYRVIQTTCKWQTIKNVFIICMSPIVHLACPPKVCITFVSHFSWVFSRPKRNWRQCLCKILGGGQTKCIMGDVQMMENDKVWQWIIMQFFPYLICYFNQIVSVTKNHSIKTAPELHEQKAFEHRDLVSMRLLSHSVRTKNPNS